MDAITEFLNRVSYKFPKGYPDLNDPSDRDLLESLMGVKEAEEEESDESPQKPQEVSKQELVKMIDAFKSIKEPYSKYLSVFNYFDPYSLGTISEVLLTKLLNKMDGVEASHVGGGQGLADLIVDGKPISLKTTDSKKPIGLGSDELRVSQADVNQVATDMKEVFKENPELKGSTISQLEGQIDNELFEKIENRIDAIVTKLVGLANKEYFVWVEKKMKDGFLQKVVFHIIKYERDKVKRELMNHPFYSTEKAWGLKDENNKILVQADASGKLLNVTPAFVKNASQDTTFDVDLATNLKDKPENIKEKVPEQFFNALDSIYSSIFSNSGE